LPDSRAAVQRFFHDLATPMSAVSLHLERAMRLSDKGEDPSEPLRVARRELERLFELFERGRESLLARGEEP
jgi:signal transduction histidine kinase